MHAHITHCRQRLSQLPTRAHTHPQGGRNPPTRLGLTRPPQETTPLGAFEACVPQAHPLTAPPSPSPPFHSELGKITLDKTFEEREALNLAIVASINSAAEAWGLQCLRYEIKDITPPAGMMHAGLPAACLGVWVCQILVSSCV